MVAFCGCRNVFTIERYFFHRNQNDVNDMQYPICYYSAFSRNLLTTKCDETIFF